MTHAAVGTLDENTRWRARDVRYLEGTWEQLRDHVPTFELRDFRTDANSPANPYLKAVIRLPLTRAERPIPVGVVSNRYTLADHAAVAEGCLHGMRQCGLDPRELRCQLGMTELGEWMHLRIYFPDRFNHAPRDGEGLGLRLECFNSVDGSSRLVLLLGWLRFVCSNGLVIGETMGELRDIHDDAMDLSRIPGMVVKALGAVEAERVRLRAWDGQPVTVEQIVRWADGPLANAWGKKAACRVFHVCTSGFDVEYSDPFESATPTTKSVDRTRRVPGAPDTSRTLYDASQALSWIATLRGNVEERLKWQTGIPGLVHLLQELA